MERNYDINGYTVLKFKKKLASKYGVYYDGETDTLSDIVQNLDFVKVPEFAQFTEITNDIFIKEFDNVFSEWFEIVDAGDVRKKYSSVIADIYAEHHVSPFTDIEKHNEGIIKAMVDFAKFYKENS